MVIPKATAFAEISQAWPFSKKKMHLKMLSAI